MNTLNKTQKIILKELFLKKNATRKELADKAGISLPALTLSLKRLFEKEMLLSSKNSNGKVGRDKEILTLNPDYAHFLSIDIRQHHVTFVVIDFQGNILEDKEMLLTEEPGKEVESIIRRYHIDQAIMTYRFHPNKVKVNELYGSMIGPLIHNGIPLNNFNNVEALSLIYEFRYPSENSFLLLKYGPGMGSSIFVNGSLVRSDDSENSEIGHVYLPDGKRLEDILSYTSLFGKPVSEPDGYELLKKDQKLTDHVLDILALTLVDADSFLSLDKIIFAGLLLSDDKILNEIKRRAKKIAPDFNVEKISTYPDYAFSNKLKGVILGFLTFLDQE